MTMTDMSVIDDLAAKADEGAEEARPVQGPVSTDGKPKKARKTPAKKAAKKKAATKAKKPAKKAAKKKAATKAKKPAKKAAKKKAATKAKKPAKTAKAKAPKKAAKPRTKKVKDVVPTAVRAPKPSKAKAPATDKPKRTYTRTGQFIGILLRLPLEILDAIDADREAKGIATRAEWARQTINRKLGISSKA
jgi:cytoskeletal protein RodZ